MVLVTKQATVDDWGADCPSVADDVEHCEFCDDPVPVEANADHYTTCSEAPSELEY